jgi:hypothetical protein
LATAARLGKSGACLFEPGDKKRVEGEVGSIIAMPIAPTSRHLLTLAAAPR